MELNGKYALLDTNGGYICPFGALLPACEDDDSAVTMVTMLYSFYDKGVKEGRGQIKSEFKQLLID